MSRDSNSQQLPLGVAQVMYGLVHGAITTHKALSEHLYDDVVWNNPVPTREGGVMACETLLGRKGLDSKKRKAIRSDLEYWTNNYETLRKEVFYRPAPKIK